MIVHGDVVLVSLKHVVLVSLKLTQSMSMVMKCERVRERSSSTQ